MRFVISIALGLLASCHHHHRDHAPVWPVFRETERNDDPLTANHFGVLRPGDHFFIEGFVRDDMVDPFDGFAFTAGVPLHVDFQLFSGNAAADLDVCLYDPQLAETVACFATDQDPEQGGVDVFVGGLDFHLVVESFVGDASYSLEIVVLPLTTSLDASGLRTAGLSAVNPADEHGPRARDGYRARRPAKLFEMEQSLILDPTTGIELELVRILGRSR